jgi:hypothetical protein
MKIYCINEKCPNHIKGYAHCTALMNVKDCPENITKEEKKNETECKSNSNV